MDEKERVAQQLISQLNEKQKELDDAQNALEIKREAILDAVKDELIAAENLYTPDIERLTGVIEKIESQLKYLSTQEKKSFSFNQYPFAVVYYEGRISWDSKGLLGYAVANPDILAFKKQGEPYATIRKSKSK